MILRKPYAAFIKYFKLLHAIMASFIVLVLYRSFSLYRFFSLYSVDYRSATSNFLSGNYLNILSFMVVFAVLFLDILLFSVMLYKKKPLNVYIYNLIVFLLVIVLYYFCDSSLNSISSVVLDVRVSKAFRDFSLIAVLFEISCLFFIVIRATGFDIKKFDFVNDLHSLDISLKDSEEIEVALDFDKDEIIRNFKSKFRNLKYLYFEHKFIINVVCLFAIVFFGGFIYYNISIYKASYKQGDTFEASNYFLNVKDSYLLNSNINGNRLVVDYNDNKGILLVVRLQIKGYVKDFNTGIMTLRIGDLSYSQNVSYANELYDLGQAYFDQKITDEFTTYLFAFEIPEAFSKRKMELKFNDSISFVKGEIGAKNIYVRLKPVDLTKVGQTFEKKLGDVLSFEDTYLGSSSIKIDNFEINNKFKVDYKYCYRNDKCIDSSEYVSASATGNYFKTLLKLSGNFIIDSSNNIKNIYDIRSFLNSFGVISYEIDGQWKYVKIDSNVIKPTNAKVEDYFIEVPIDVKNASHVNLIFNVRNNSFKYTLK